MQDCINLAERCERGGWVEKVESEDERSLKQEKDTHQVCLR
jgi:hypothetical protein